VIVRTSRDRTHTFLFVQFPQISWRTIRNNKDWTYGLVGSTDLGRRLVRVLLVSIRPFFIHTSRTITLLQATSTSASTLFLGKRWPSSSNLLKPSTRSSSTNPRSTRLSPEALVCHLSDGLALNAITTQWFLTFSVLLLRIFSISATASSA